MCKRHRAAQHEQGLAKLKALRNFISKHLYIFAEAGIRALDLCGDITRAERSVLVVLVRSRPGSPRSEKSFYCIGADVLGMEELSLHRQALIRKLLELGKDHNARSNMIGTAIVILQCADADESASTLIPICFDEEVHLRPPGTPWLEWMTDRLNEGVVS